MPAILSGSLFPSDFCSWRQLWVEMCVKHEIFVQLGRRKSEPSKKGSSPAEKAVLVMTINFRVGRNWSYIMPCLEDLSSPLLPRKQRLVWSGKVRYLCGNNVCGVVLVAEQSLALEESPQICHRFSITLNKRCFLVLNSSLCSYLWYTSPLCVLSYPPDFLLSRPVGVCA